VVGRRDAHLRKATLGFYITKHPLTQYESLIRALGTCDTLGAKSAGDGSKIILGGLISKVRSVPIRNGRSAGQKLVIALIEDFVGSIEATLFPDQLPELQPLLKPDSVVFLEATVDRRREEPSLRIAGITSIDDARRKFAQSVLVSLQTTGGPSDVLPRVQELCVASRGKTPVLLRVSSPEGWVATLRGGNGGIDPSDDLLASLSALAGAENVAVVGPRGPVAIAGRP
jgi:DNA polymerase-3 subunit alpha